MSDRVDQLEYTLMELGAQVFRLKQEVSSLNSSQTSFVRVFKKLRVILDEKGVLDSEDFELMTDFYHLIDGFEDPYDVEQDQMQTSPKSDLH